MGEFSQKLLWFFAATVFVVSSGCSDSGLSDDSADFPSVGSSGGTGTADPDAFPSTDPAALTALSSPLYLGFYTKITLSDSEEIRNRRFCYIDPANLGTNVVNCTFSVPEGDLRYSKTTFIVGTAMTQFCSRIDFHPYYRRLSDAVAYRPYRGDTDVDCSADPIPLDCYGGVAKDIVPSFPKNTAMWISTYLKASQTYVAKSAWEANSYGNTHVCNNLAPGSRGMDQTPPPPFAAIQQYESSNGEFQDYQVICRDAWEEPTFVLNITIQDDDTPATPTTPAQNQFWDWN